MESVLKATSSGDDHNNYNKKNIAQRSSAIMRNPNHNTQGMEWAERPIPSSQLAGAEWSGTKLSGQEWADSIRIFSPSFAGAEWSGAPTDNDRHLTGSEWTGTGTGTNLIGHEWEESDSPLPPQQPELAGREWAGTRSQTPQVFGAEWAGGPAKARQLVGSEWAGSEPGLGYGLAGGEWAGSRGRDLVGAEWSTRANSPDVVPRGQLRGGEWAE